MELKRDSSDNLQQKVDKNKKFSSNKNHNYLYTNSELFINQIRWFNHGKDRLLRMYFASSNEK